MQELGDTLDIQVPETLPRRKWIYFSAVLACAVRAICCQEKCCLRAADGYEIVRHLRAPKDQHVSFATQNLWVYAQLCDINVAVYKRKKIEKMGKRRGGVFVPKCPNSLVVMSRKKMAIGGDD